MITNQAEQITSNDAYNTSPACSPDGTKLAFSSKRDTGNYELYIMDIESKETRRLTFDSKQ